MFEARLAVQQSEPTCISAAPSGVQWEKKAFLMSRVEMQSTKTKSSGLRSGWHRARLPGPRRTSRQLLSPPPSHGLGHEAQLTRCSRGKTQRTADERANTAADGPFLPPAVPVQRNEHRTQPGAGQAEQPAPADQEVVQAVAVPGRRSTSSRGVPARGSSPTHPPSTNT